MCTGGDFLEESKIYKKDVNMLKHKITFKTNGWNRGGRGIIVAETKPNAVYRLACPDIDVGINPLASEFYI
jgi:hypothetical protein